MDREVQKAVSGRGVSNADLAHAQVKLEKALWLLQVAEVELKRFLNKAGKHDSRARRSGLNLRRLVDRTDRLVDRLAAIEAKPKPAGRLAKSRGGAS